MTSREQFEKWVGDSVNSDVHRGIMLSRHENGNYSHLATRHKWDAWQASRAAIEIELPTSFEGPYMALVMYTDEVENAIELAGLKVKA
jgi:hypothetical protein